ncbi:hypothetical protein PQ465_14805 [Sphingobacterium oryzagri]|uniref:Uncharacterized protein n=1 Tax=Sphingobacterium oryzagri TaxID=3025669 RepID=A0ABY7WD37_9SPHI|nr:hypothetical protein [Sphingobacterium sp. KACC 22765]WDF67567.1 hypothetical protein PQ465_14805 [Sphingobacterium sp. KACC 22765]
MAKQFFIPTSKNLADINVDETEEVFSYLRNLITSNPSDVLTDQPVYSMSYIDSNNDEIVYRVGKEHPHKSVSVLAILKVGEVYHVFPDEANLQPERLDFSGTVLRDVQFFE